MVVPAMGVGHPQSLHLYTGITKALDYSYGQFYQVDQDGGTIKHHDNECPEVIQEKHTSQVEGPPSHYNE